MKGLGFRNLVYVSRNFMRAFPIAILLMTSILSFAQERNCGFQIDTAQVLNNRNLQSLVRSLYENSLTTLNHKKAIPSFVKNALDCWTKKFDIANSTQPFQAGDVVLPRIKPLPRRQLTYLGFNDHYLLMTYKKGGIGMSHHVLIFKFDNKKIVDFWAGYGGELKTKEEVLNYLKEYGDKTQTNVINL